VWDTRANNGVLLYLLLADQAIEIVADRGLHARVSDAEWESVCAAVEAGIRGADMEHAVIDGIRRISALLAVHCPAAARALDEIPDRPVLL
ncbi:MAG TPA: TPM domain-containing protein, partial [Pseudoxanthomonas sp.]|nr:TPM domain-containing protein [Pseudoxanthomonas sp.]